MPPQVELFCIGFAAVVDTVLLLVVLERINRPLTAIWLKWAVTGVTLWHVGSFLHATLRDTSGDLALRLDGCCMAAMAFGLLLLTNSMLHGALRINHVGAIAHPPFDRRYIAVYFPMLFVVPVTAAIFRSGSRDFIEATADYRLPYLVWLMAANGAIGFLLLRNRDKYDPRSVLSGRFIIRFSIGLAVVTLMTLWYVTLSHTSRFEEPVRILTTVSPLLPTLIFAYYIFRRRLLPLVFERTLAYGAILLAVLYLHSQTITPLMKEYTDRLKFDLVIIEGLLLVALTLGYTPLRNRIRESLRYLLGRDVSRVRDATRQLSVEMSRRSSDDMDVMAEWFVSGLVDALHLRFAAVFCDELTTGKALSVCEDDDRNKTAASISAEHLAELKRFLDNEPEPVLDRSRCRSSEQLTVMRELDLIAACRMEYQQVNGQVLLGATRGGDRLSDEQLNTISVLVDQFAATLENRRLQGARQSAERRAAQQEKLSTLGLLSGSLAHELKNPLSSMKTVATLLKEDLGESESADEVQMIIAEIDRLTQTSQSLLDFSRPADASHVGVAPDAVVERLLRILSHLAKQHNVSLTTDLTLGECQAAATDAAVSEIMFNLIKNAIEAVREQQDAAVSIESRRSEACVLLTVRDNGPGISADQQSGIFDPFVTGKSDGTGLGLYVVSERVREFGGTVECQTQPGRTDFEVRLPVCEQS